MVKKKFNVTGMACSACSSKVEKNVSNINGVSNVSVNLLTNSMILDYDEKQVTIDIIKKCVIDLGFGISEYNNRYAVNKSNKSDVKDSSKIANEIRNKDIKLMKLRIIISFCFLIPLMYISMHSMLNKWIGLPIPLFIKNIFDGTQNSLLFAFSQFILLLPILYVNQKYYKIGYKSLIKKSPNMDTLIALGSSAATLYGIYAIFRLGYGLGHNNIATITKYSNDIYFESAGTILTLITLGKYFEAKSKGKTSEAIEKLIKLAPKTALVERDGVEIEIGIEDVKKDDLVIIKPGISVSVDGVIVEGTSSIDEAAITGESMPVEKRVGDTVIAATVNKLGFLKVKATKVGEDTTISQIIKLVEEASSSKAPIAKLADKVAGVFVPLVMGISILCFLIWILSGASFEFSLSIAIAVLVISCPCALGLATPVAIMVGTGKGAENGILIKSGDALEIAHMVDTVVLDKTGTITEGKPYVTDIISYNNTDKNKLLKIAVSLEKSSEHPLAEAIINYGNKNNITEYEITDFSVFSGKGVSATINNKIYYAGNKSLMDQINVNTNVIENNLSSVTDNGKTPMIFSDNERIIGLIAVADVIKKNSAKAVEQLKSMNIDVIMLTGDNKKTAEAIQKSVNVTKVYAEVLPHEKERKVSDLQKSGRKVAMVGDGINDSPALARADVGIAIGAGTDIAIESADIVLVKNDIMDVVSAIKLSKAVIRNIKQNLFWAFFYNTLCIPLAAGILYAPFNIKLSPMIGAAAMGFSSVFVVSNALRLKMFKSE